MQPKKILKAIKELCTGCHTCEIMCSLKHTGMVKPALARISVGYSKEGPLPFPIICEHCKDTPCKEACPVPDAMYTDEKTGAVIIDDDYCTQCLACVEACPFGAIQVGPNQEILKCDLCGGDPVCAKFCPEVPGNRFPHLPWPTQSCLQYVEPSQAKNNQRSMSSEKGEK